MRGREAGCLCAACMSMRLLIRVCALVRQHNRGTTLCSEVKTRTAIVNYDVEVEGILGRTATQNFIKPATIVSPTPLATAPFATGTVMNPQGTRCKVDEIPTCNIVTGVNETFARDSITGHSYYDLLPASVRNGGGAKSRFSLDNDDPGQHISYDNNGSFPEWCGSSVSFSIWVRMDSGMSYIINRYQDRTKVWTDHHWKLYVEKGRMTLYSQNPSTGAQDGTQYGEVPAHLEWQFGDMQAFRHLVFVLDHQANSVVPHPCRLSRR